jgi:hypothetical protein
LQPGPQTGEGTYALSRFKLWIFGQPSIYSHGKRGYSDGVGERVASSEEIDKALKLGYNLPTGPPEVSDFTGTWQILVTSEQDAMRELGPDKGRLHPLVRMMDRAGYSKIYDF